MADLSTGNDDKSVTKTNSFKLFGRTPARTVSSKKSSNIFSKIFSRSKKLDKQTVAEYADEDPSNRSETAIDEVIEGTAPAATLLEKLQEDPPKLIQQVVSQANTDNLAAEFTKSIPVANSKEYTPAIAATEEKKSEFFSKLIEGAEKAKEELQGKAKEELQKIKGGLTEAHKSFTSTYNKQAPIEQQSVTVDDKKIQEKDVKIIDEPTNVTVPLSSPSPTLEEAGAAAGVAETTKTEGANQGDSPAENNKQEENCVTYLAEGLQKMCATWKNDNKKED